MVLPFSRSGECGPSTFDDIVAGMLRSQKAARPTTISTKPISESRRMDRQLPRRAYRFRSCRSGGGFARPFREVAIDLGGIERVLAPDHPTKGRSILAI